MVGRDAEVLVVDQSRECAEQYRARSEDAYTVNIATNGADAFDLFESSFDLVLVDPTIPPHPVEIIDPVTRRVSPAKERQ